MARIPDELIEQVRDSADLLEIVQESVDLKRTGSDWRGPCPFHGGTNRNFAVIPRKNIYYCFVCHASGDVFTWYRERMGLDYPSAVREAARRAGIVIPEGEQRSGPDPREPLFQAAEAASGWYADQLRGDGAERARRYLQGRDILLDAAGERRLGWAPGGPAFAEAMSALGIKEEVLIEVGLLMQREDGTCYPRFRDRLLFPIADLRGRVVGFGGRRLDDGEPKYLNSPETPIFHKGRLLYHLDVARLAIRQAGVALLVEGYFDVIRLSLAGVDNVVAPMGTALTQEQAILLKRYGEEIVLCYDSDPAGLRATFRAADIMLAAGARVRVATMPEGEDPDSLVQRGGAVAIERLLADALDVIERKLQLLDRGGWFSDSHRSREALDRLLPTLRATSDDVTRELYQSRVAERLGVPREVVAAEVAAVRQRHGGTGERRAAAAHATRASSASSPPAGEPAVPGAQIERKLLRLLLQRADWLDRARSEVLPERFHVPSYRRIFEALAALDPGQPAGEAAGALDERSRAAWDRLAASGELSEAFGVDHEYVGALEALEERELFASIAAEPDPVERTRRRQALSAEGRQRFSYYLEVRKHGRIH